MIKFPKDVVQNENCFNQESFIFKMKYTLKVLFEAPNMEYILSKSTKIEDNTSWG